MPPVSPIAAKWELVAICRERREELGLTGPAVAKAAQVSSTFWSRFENDKKLVGPEKFALVLDVLEFPKDLREHLLKLREYAVGTGWWAAYNKIFSPQHINLYGLEYGAEEVRTFESLLIPGLLQTEAYIRALIETDQIGIPAKEVQRRVAARLKRQERLRDRDPLRLVAVVSQAAIEQQFGGPDVLREQLDHLSRMIRSNPETIDLRIIPFTSPTGPILGGCTFYILEFTSAALGPLAWYESPLEAKIIDDPDRVFDISRSFQQMHDQALSAADSLALIEESARKIEERS
ncbi:helix-turn-helix domain-containing protein [Nocardia sp. NPDC004068]|uniref:helix-turn-helix domain-containing protein n=1 Tax=Nocardia sp. NPDC004068 TaxID=3364303 RepID=UPI0036D06E4A